MKTRSEVSGPPTIYARTLIDPFTVLSVSPLDADHLSLESILGNSTFTLFKARDLVSASVLLKQYDIAVVLCERDLLLGTWIDVLEHIAALPIIPSLIVTSRLADERLWAEALNLGAWDVLASNPFVPGEVIRSVESGWRHWDYQIQIRATEMRTLAAAG